ncbi:MAG: glycoside hydrolase family 16 protein, partial [Thermoleophilaceae bacterium]
MKAFGRHGVVACLVVLVTAGLAARADSAAAVTLRDFDVSVRGSRVSSDYRISTGRPRSFDQVVVATRDASGRHHDFGHRSPRIDGRRSFSVSTRLPPGRYRSRIAYTFNGRRWFDLRPRRKFRVRNPDAPAQSTTPSERECGGGEVNEPAGGPWRLAFRDEFNDAELNTTKWDWKYPRSGDMIHSNWGNGEAQWYRRENLREANGCLRLVAKRERTVSPYSGETFDYTSGLIQSKPSFNFRYGYMEARMRLPSG